MLANAVGVRVLEYAVQLCYTGTVNGGATNSSASRLLNMCNAACDQMQQLQVNPESSQNADAKRSEVQCMRESFGKQANHGMINQ
jgi:hypothetical protein